MCRALPAALDQFTQCTALDLADKRIRVNSVNPAYVRTPILQTVGIPKEAVDEIVKQYESRYPRKWHDFEIDTHTHTHD